MEIIADIAIFYGFTFAIGAVLGLISEWTDNSIFIDWLDDATPLDDYLFSYAVLVSYYIISEGLSQRTIGKYITNTIVVDEFGNKPPLKNIVVRSFCRLIPFDGLTFFNDSRGWHDRFSDTYLFKKNVLDRKISLEKDFDEIGKSEL